MSKDFSGKVVLVTGSSSGIGEGIAILFAKLGAHVVVSGLFHDDVSRVANSCQSISPKKLKPLEVVADITGDEEAKNLIETTIHEFGKIDILVNNAAGLWFADILSENFMDVYEKTMRLNVRSVVYLTHLAVPHLEKTKGNIINISSICSTQPLRKAMAYNMTKSAIDMFTKCLAVELGPKGIRVNSINPSALHTNIWSGAGMSDEIIGATLNAYVKNSCVGRLGEPADVANAAVFLASDEASFITGANVLVDGGMILFSR